MLKKRLVIIGGGLAGLTCAIHLMKNGHSVTLIEKNSYPHHKVCGEFISNEVRSYLHSLDIDINSLHPSEIDTVTISAVNGYQISAKLPLGGFGISRYTLDNYLFEKALAMGCEFIADAVENIAFINDEFQIQTASNGILIAELAIAAYGKRSSLDQKLEREFMKQKSDWLAVKAHYKGNIHSTNVSLHNFTGGYCGLSEVENGVINVCYLTDYKHFKAYKNIAEFQEQVLSKNPLLKDFFKQSKMIFDHPITISQISFSKKKPVENHVLMIGDTAGLIHPLCGNGMAMAIHSAKICAELCSDYLDDTVVLNAGIEPQHLYHNTIELFENINHNTNKRLELERQYSNTWRTAFHKRLLIGRILSSILKKDRALTILLYLLSRFPFLLTKIIRGTHGKEII